MRKQNVIIFSSSKSLGFVENLAGMLGRSGLINAVTWKQYFSDAFAPSYSETKALPLFRVLTKRIPSFDFAIIVAGQDDIVPECDSDTQTDDEEKYKMRDNVIFELGMCCMALGESRVILLRGENVRLFANLRGISADQQMVMKEDNKLHITPLTTENIQIEAMEYSAAPSPEDMEELKRKILQHIEKNCNNYAPVVVGAAASTASGYFGNFLSSLYRSFEQFFKPDSNFVLTIDGDVSLTEKIRRELKIRDVEFHVLIPNETAMSSNHEIMDNPKVASSKLYGMSDCKISEHCCLGPRLQGEGGKQNRAGRQHVFACKYTGKKLHVIDIPTTILASYKTATAILDMKDDAFPGENQEIRYMNKEISMFTATLDKLRNAELPEAQIFVEDFSMDPETVKKELPWLYE